MITVAIWRFISDDETGAGFLYFFADSRIEIDKIDFKAIDGHLPGPFGFVPSALMRQGVTVEQVIATIFSHRSKSALLAFARPVSISNDDLSIFHFDLDFIDEAALLEQDFGQTNTLRVADLNDFCFHGIQSNYRTGKTQ